MRDLRQVGLAVIGRPGQRLEQAGHQVCRDPRQWRVQARDWPQLSACAVAAGFSPGFAAGRAPAVIST